VRNAQTEIVAIARRTRVTIVAIILALLCAPPLVRAAGSLDASTGTPLLRLNRGVDIPETKCRIAAAAIVIAVVNPATIRDLPSLQRAVFLIVSAQPPAITPALPTTFFRGPPSASR
jgi:hypothetical protein